MTPTSNDPDDSRPNAAAPELQQLEAALRAGLISPELFATLAAQLRPAGAAGRPVATTTATGPDAEPTELPSLLSLFESPPAAPASPAGPTPAAPAGPALAPPPVVAVPPLMPPSTPPPPTPLPSPAQPVAPPAATPATSRPPMPPVAPPPAHDPVLKPEPAAPPRRNALTTLLAALGGAGLLGVCFYLYVDRSHPDEHLTGPPPAPTEAAPTEAAAPPPEATVAAPLEPAPAAAPAEPTADSSAQAPAPAEAAPPEAPAATPDAAETAGAPAPETANAPTAAPTTTTAAAPTAAPVPAAPEPDDDAATQKIRTVLAGYYADLFAPPLTAENYFAPQVERLYIQQHLTPAQINATITQTFFPDNQKAVYQVEPGTLRVSAPAQDGSRTATYNEACRLFRVSRGRYQRLRTQVRVKLDADYRITFLRQEKMLENGFE